MMVKKFQKKNQLQMMIFSSYDLKAHNIAEKYTATYKDMLNKDTYLNTKNGLIEYQDGRKIEFIHKNAIMNGPAIEYLANGDKNRI